MLKPLLFLAMSNEAETKPLVHVSMPPPRLDDLEVIKAAALKLDLPDLIALRDALNESIRKEENVNV